jgi:sporulation protein YabP
MYKAACDMTPGLRRQKQAGTLRDGKDGAHMAYEEKYKTVELPHNVIIEGRKKLSVSGVDDVESFDENEVIMSTAQGILFIRGSSLRIEKLSLDSGDVVLEGVIDKLEYEDDVKASGGLFSRLFK